MENCHNLQAIYYRSQKRLYSLRVILRHIGHSLLHFWQTLNYNCCLILVVFTKEHPIACKMVSLIEKLCIYRGSFYLRKRSKSRVFIRMPPEATVSTPLHLHLHLCVLCPLQPIMHFSEHWYPTSYDLIKKSFVVTNILEFLMKILIHAHFPTLDNMIQERSAIKDNK